MWTKSGLKESSFSMTAWLATLYYTCSMALHCIAGCTSVILRVYRGPRSKTFVLYKGNTHVEGQMVRVGNQRSNSTT